MNDTFSRKEIGVVVLIALVLLFYGFNSLRIGFGAAPLGLDANVATSSLVTVTSSGSATPVFATSTCASRIIGTGSSAVMVTFGNSQGFQASGARGYWQAASTTVVYDGGLYGCDAAYIVSNAASAVINVTETR